MSSLLRGVANCRPSSAQALSASTQDLQTVLAGSGVVISGVISPLIWVISISIYIYTYIVTLLIAPRITAHEPPSRASLVL